MLKKLFLLMILLNQVNLSPVNITISNSSSKKIEIQILTKHWCKYIKINQTPIILDQQNSKYQCLYEKGVKVRFIVDGMQVKDYPVGKYNNWHFLIENDGIYVTDIDVSFFAFWEYGITPEGELVHSFAQT